VAEGTFHESLNLAALWQLPVLFLCENNLYAMGTRLDRHQAMTDIHAKAAGYGIAAAAVDGMDVRAVEAAARKAAAGVTERAFAALAKPVARVCTAEVPIPYAAQLEQAALPSVDRIVAAAREIVA